MIDNVLYTKLRKKTIIKYLIKTSCFCSKEKKIGITEIV